MKNLTEPRLRDIAPKWNWQKWRRWIYRYSAAVKTRFNNHNWENERAKKQLKTLWTASRRAKLYRNRNIKTLFKFICTVCLPPPRHNRALVVSLLALFSLLANFFLYSELFNQIHTYITFSIISTCVFFLPLPFTHFLSVQILKELMLLNDVVEHETIQAIHARFACRSCSTFLLFFYFKIYIFWMNCVTFCVYFLFLFLSTRSIRNAESNFDMLFCECVEESDGWVGRGRCSEFEESWTK